MKEIKKKQTGNQESSSGDKTDKNQPVLPEEAPLSYGSGNAFEKTENPSELRDKDLSDEQLDELLSDD